MSAPTTTTTSPIVLITGGNTGLGFEIVKSLCQSSSSSYTILLGGRDLQKAEAAVEKVRAEIPDTASIVKAIQVDIEDDESIAKAFEHVAEQYGRVDVLINNAGAQFDQQLHQGKMSMREMWNKSWNVNITGTQILTHTFAPLLLRSADARLIFMASGTANLTDSDNTAFRFNISPPKGWPKPAGGYAAYRSSKTGLNMMMREWVRLLHEDGVKIWAVSPGFLATNLGGDRDLLRKSGALDPTIGANLVRDVVEGKRDQDVGKVIRKDGVQPW